MEKIVVNTSQIKKQISEIKIQQNYYSNKQNVFVGSKYQANSKLVTFLSKINNNYVNITNNLRQIINYLEDYIHDVEGLERKFSHNGGSIEVSQVSSIANRYYDVIDNFEFNETPYFKLSLFQSVSSDIKNFFSKNQKVEVQSFVVEDDVYNEVLDMYEEQFDLNMEYYEGQIAALKKEIDKYAEIENAKTMLKYAQQNGVPTSETGSLNNPITCQQNLEAALAKFGFSSVEEYDAFIEELNNGINVSNEYIRQLELSKKMGKYDCLLLVKDFESFLYENHADAKEIDRIAQGSESESLRFDYNEYVSVYPEVSIMDYVATLSEMYNEENIKFYATPEVYQAYELYQASLVTQETGDSEILLGMNLTNAYNYMFEKYGVEEANKYLSTVEDRVNQILGEQDAIERISYLNSEEDVVSILKNEVYTTASGLGDGVANWGESIGHAFDAIATVLGGKEADRTMSRNEYAQQYFINALASGEYTGPFLMENYEISQGIGYMVPSILVSKGMGALGASATVASTGGSVAMGVSSFGGNYHSSLVEGYSENQALAYGAISGVSEAAFEKFLGGIVSDVAVVDGKSFLQSIAKEATEEGLQNIVDLQVRSALFGESYTTEEYIQSTAKSAIYGGITAGILNSPSAIANGIKVSKVNTAVNNGSLNMEEIVTNLRNSGLNIDFNGKTDSQIISENADIVYDIYQSALKENKIDDNLSVDSFSVSVEAQIEEANYHVQKGDLLHKTIETDSIKNITPELLSKIDDPSAISFKIGNQNYSYLDVKQMIGMVDMSSSSSPLTINQKIEQANLYTSKGNFSTIDASLSDFTLDNLATVQNPDSFYARLEDGNVYSFYQIVDALVDESHHWIDREHGFQVNKSDLDAFYRYKLESGFFSEEQITNMLNNLNSKGYISEELGSYIVSLFQDNQSDIYVKTISTNDMQSIHEKGIYCNGNITSGANNLGNLNLEHTVTKVNSVYDLISILKNANGLSQGMNPIDGAVILKVPKNADIADITYTFSNEVGDTVTAINPMYIQKFVSTDVNHVVSEADVKVQSNVSLNLDDVVKENDISSHFNQLPSNLQDFIKNIAENTNSDYLSVKRLSDVIYNGLTSGDTNTQTIMNNLYKINDYLEIVFSDSLKDENTNWSNGDRIFGNKFANLSTAIGKSNGSFLHELGHALLDIVHNKSIPDDYNNIRSDVINNWQNNPNLIESFLQEARDYKERIWSETVLEAENWHKQNSSDIEATINEALLDDNKLKQLLRDSAIRYNVSESQIDSEVEKLKSYSFDRIMEYINKSFINQYIFDNFNNKCNVEPTVIIYEIVTGLIDSMYLGTNPYYSTIYDNGFLRSHSSQYFNDDINKGFSEQFADFCRIKMDNSQVAYQICEKIFGSNWIQMMEQEYASVASDLSNDNLKYDKDFWKQTEKEIFDNLTVADSNFNILSRLKSLFKPEEVKGPIEFQNQTEVAEFFNDPKQYLYSTLKNYLSNEIDSFLNQSISTQDLQKLQTKPLDDKIRYLYDNFNVDNTYLSSWLSWYFHFSNVDSTQSIDYYGLYDFMEKNNLLDKKAVKTLKSLESQMQNFTDLEKFGVYIFTKWAGPALSAYNRGTTIIFPDRNGFSMIDGTNLNWIQDYLNKCVESYNQKFPNNTMQNITINQFNALMDKIIADSPAIKENIIVYRGADRLFFNGDPISIYDLKPGTIFNDKAHISTSTMLSDISSSRQIMLEIEVPAGTKAAYLEQITGISKYNQQELLLSRFTQFQITEQYRVLQSDIQESTQNQQRPDIVFFVKAKVLNEFETYNMSMDYNNYFNNISGIDAHDLYQELRDSGLLVKYYDAIEDMHKKDLYTGIDGVLSGEHDYVHVQNVLLYSMYMGQAFNLPASQMNLLIESAKYHDAGIKVLNGNHKNHAEVSAFVIQENLSSQYNANDIAKIQAIVELHDKDISLVESICSKYGIINASDINEVKQLCAILKDADALDRTRFPGNLDVRYFQNDFASSLVQSSYQVREQKAYENIRECLNNGRYTATEEQEVRRLINLDYPYYIIDFAYRYYNTSFAIGYLSGERYNSITSFAEYILQNRTFRVK